MLHGFTYHRMQKKNNKNNRLEESLLTVLSQKIHILLLTAENVVNVSDLHYYLFLKLLMPPKTIIIAVKVKASY